MMTTNRKRPVYSKLKAFLIENSLKQKDLALFLKISKSQLNQKLNGTGVDFTMEEARLICKHLNISGDEFFFRDEVSKTIIRRNAG